MNSFPKESETCFVKSVREGGRGIPVFLSYGIKKCSIPPAKAQHNDRPWCGGVQIWPSPLDSMVMNKTDEECSFHGLDRSKSRLLRSLD